MTLLASLKRDQKGRKDGLVIRVLAANFGKFSLTPRTHGERREVTGTQP